MIFRNVPALEVAEQARLDQRAAYFAGARLARSACSLKLLDGLVNASNRAGRRALTERRRPELAELLSEFSEAFAFQFGPEAASDLLTDTPCLALGMQLRVDSPRD